MNRQQRLAMIAVILGSAVVFLNGSVVGLALPKIAIEFGADFTALQWVASGYLLALSALMLLGGSLGDLFGRKRIYLIGVIGFTLATGLAAMTQSIGILIAVSIIQGAFGALITPGALAIFETNFTGVQRNKAIAHWAAWTAAAGAVGPLIGGYLADIGSWRFVFFMNIPLLVICFLLGIVGIKETRNHVRHAKVDIVGAFLGTLSLAGLIYGLIEGPATQWSWLAMSSLIGAVLVGVLFLRFESRQKNPMLNLKLFRSANFSAVNLVTFAMYGALGGFFFILAIHLQTVVGFTSLQAGLATLPVTLMLLLFSSKIGVLADKYGPKVFMTTGPLITALGIIILLPVNADTQYFLHILPGLLLFGLGLTFTVTPLTITLLKSVKPENAGIASAINNAVSRAAGLVVIAVLGLFGADDAYGLAVIVSAGLAICAGILAFIFVNNSKRHSAPKS